MKRFLLALAMWTTVLSASEHPDARDYWREVTPAEWRVMHTIVTTLSETDLLFLWPKEAFLEREGDRVDHIHPLRFLLTLFSSEELKVATRNIRNEQPGLVWKRFCSRFSRSLDLAKSRDNISNEIVVHFARTLQLNVDQVRGLIATSDWEGIMNLLATEVERSGDYRRYDL